MKMIPYIGDISKADAEVLNQCARKYANILEFGCGASTQVIAASAGISLVTSIDTDQGWIEKTIGNLALLEIKKEVTFLTYDTFMSMVKDGKRDFDFIFVDGVDSLRRTFAIDIWPYLVAGGIMAFHDTRRAHDFRNVLEVLAQFQNEVGTVEFNCQHSNITIVQKNAPEPYDNWQITENKQPWQLGYGDVPPEEVDKIKKQIQEQSKTKL
jgi:predicted O-methyltransferase YrrM